MPRLERTTLTRPIDCCLGQTAAVPTSIERSSLSCPGQTAVCPDMRTSPLPDEPLGHCAVPVRHGARHPRLKAKLAARLRFAWPTASGYAYCRCGLSLAVMPPTSRAVCPRVKPRLHLRQRLLCLDSLRLSETRHSASTRRDPASMPTIVNFVSTCQAEAVALGQEELRSHARGKPRVLAGQAK